MTTLRRLVFAAALIAIALFAAMFAYNNPEPIDVDVGFMRVERVSLAVAFGVALAIGWVLGLVSATFALWRRSDATKRLRKELLAAESELRTLRKEPSADAD